MRLLADENIPFETVRALRAAGHDVFSAAESAPGSAGELLLGRANTDARLLVTFDRDFGDLAVRVGQPAAAGVVLLRMVPESADEVTKLLTGLLARADIEWSGRITVIERTQIRQRRL